MGRDDGQDCGRGDIATASVRRTVVEVDGEFCVPLRGRPRSVHYIDLGPILGTSSDLPGTSSRRSLFFLPAIFLFILAIQLMKAGAKAVGPVDRGTVPLRQPGCRRSAPAGSAPTSCCRGRPSPPRRSACSARATISKLQTFTMLSGSRLGASFIVLAHRVPLRDPATGAAPRGDSIGIGIQAMTMTAVSYLPGMLLGYGILRSGRARSDPAGTPSGKLDAVLGTLWGPVRRRCAERTFPAGRCSPLGTGRRSSCRSTSSTACCRT